MTEVSVRKLKWLPDAAEPREVLSWRAQPLGQDDHGTWLHCPAGSVTLRANGDGRTSTDSGVQLLPAVGWWAAWWWRDRHLITVDICTPPQFDANAWSYIDLELDLFRNSSAAVDVVDVDEFDELVGRGVLSGELVRAARSAAEEVREALTRGLEPFGRSGWDHLARANAAEVAAAATDRG